MLVFSMLNHAGTPTAVRFKVTEALPKKKVNQRESPIE
jgi:hypothetical protein